MLTRKQKEQIVEELSRQIHDAKSVVFVDYRGLKVSDVSQLKKDLRSENAAYRVVKKRLLERAAKENKLELNTKLFEGQLAVVFSMEDEVTGAKIVEAFSKNNENIEVLGGVLENKEISVDEVKALAKLPSREELLAKLVGSINAPVSGFVNVLAGNMRGLVQALKAISDQKS